MRRTATLVWTGTRYPLILSLALMILLGITGAGQALADGGFLSYPGHYLYEPAQTAFIRYDSASATETLSIMPGFHLDHVNDFAWVVPIPSLPEVTEDDPELFQQLYSLTRPVYRSRDSFWGCEDHGINYLDTGEGGGVEVIDQKLVGIYRTMTLGADDAGALTDSLTVWGFLHDDNRDVFEPLLQDYVDDGWYFVTMTIDSAALADILPPSAPPVKSLTPPEYGYPVIQPVRFVFTSPAIVYPLRISSLSTYLNNMVNIYVAADHRLEFTGARTYYANRITQGELDVIRRVYPRLGAELREGDFLTKLYRGYSPEDMNEDIILVPAADDAEYLSVYLSGLPIWSLAFTGTIAWWLIRRRRRPLSGGRTASR